MPDEASSAIPPAADGAPGDLPDGASSTPDARSTECVTLIDEHFESAFPPSGWTVKRQGNAMASLSTAHAVNGQTPTASATSTTSIAGEVTLDRSELLTSLLGVVHVLEYDVSWRPPTTTSVARQQCLSRNASSTPPTSPGGTMLA